jgi:integrase
MTESLTTELFELLAFRRRQVLARGWKDTPDWVFCSDVGSSIDPRNFSRIWERLRRRAQAEGIRPLKLHATRHTWASMALESGKNIRWVADQLGHADPALTLRVYSHVLKSEERDLSFAEFGPKRPHTAPTKIEADERVAQPLEIDGGPPGTRTLDHNSIYLE